MSTVDTKIADRIKARIEAEIERVDATLVGGNLRNFEEYQRLSGQKKGYRDALQLVDESLEEVMKE